MEGQASRSRRETVQRVCPLTNRRSGWLGFEKLLANSGSVLPELPGIGQCAVDSASQVADAVSLPETEHRRQLTQRTGRPLTPQPCGNVSGRTDLLTKAKPSRFLLPTDRQRQADRHRDGLRARTPPCTPTYAAPEVLEGSVGSERSCGRWEGDLQCIPWGTRPRTRRIEFLRGRVTTVVIVHGIPFLGASYYLTANLASFLQLVP